MLKLQRSVVLLTVMTIGIKADRCPSLEPRAKTKERVVSYAELGSMLPKGRIWLRHRDGA
jgi:hypothetical protein